MPRIRLYLFVLAVIVAIMSLPMYRLYKYVDRYPRYYLDVHVVSMPDAAQLSYVPEEEGPWNGIFQPRKDTSHPYAYLTVDSKDFTAYYNPNTLKWIIQWGIFVKPETFDAAPDECLDLRFLHDDTQTNDIMVLCYVNPSDPSFQYQFIR